MILFLLPQIISALNLKQHMNYDKCGIKRGQRNVYSLDIFSDTISCIELLADNFSNIRIHKNTPGKLEISHGNNFAHLTNTILDDKNPIVIPFSIEKIYVIINNTKNEQIENIIIQNEIKSHREALEIPQEYVKYLYICVGAYGLFTLILLIIVIVIACDHPNRLYSMGIHGRFFFCCCASAYASAQAHYAQNIGCCNGACDAANDEECACAIVIIITFVAITVLGFVLLYMFCCLAFPQEEDLEYERREKKERIATQSERKTTMNKGLLEESPMHNVDPLPPVVSPSITV